MNCFKCIELRIPCFHDVMHCCRCSISLASVYSANTITCDLNLTPKCVHFTYYCRSCYIAGIHYALLSSYYQKEREDFINSSNYWGVFSINDLTRLKLVFKKHPGKVFFWEFPACITFPMFDIPRYILVQAITILESPTPGRVLYHSVSASSSFDRFTTYIYCLSGRYFVTYGINNFKWDNDNTPLFWRTVEYFPTLSDAISSILNDHRNRCSTKDGKAHCNCVKGNRFHYTESSKGKDVVGNVWSLQDLSAFFIRSYSVFNKEKIINLQHRFARNRILNIDSTNIFRANIGERTDNLFSNVFARYL